MNCRSFLLIVSCLICVAAEIIRAEKNAVKSKKMPKSLALMRLRYRETASTQRVPGYRKCKTQHDCSKDECCAFWNTKDVKVCKKLRLSKERCSLFEIPGLSSRCHCATGLTCALTALVHQGKPIYRCTEIPASHLDKEFEELQ